jgi:hypothetical protein
MTKRDIVILDTPEISCPAVLLFIFSELCGYFKRRGHNVNCINTISELKDNNVVFMGNTFHVKNPCELLNNQAPNAVYIGWYWRDIDVSSLKYFIHTYEDVYNIYFDSNRVGEFVRLTTLKNSVPLLLRANDEPCLIGNYERKVERDYCYMGWCYNELLQLLPNREEFKGFCHGVINHNEYLNYEDRKKIYLSSMFALGVQSDLDIRSEKVTQRIYEGLAYGCIVLTNSKAACEQTNNIAVYVSSKDDVEKTMRYYKENPHVILEKQQQGYEFTKRLGTNELSMQKFKDKFSKLFSINIEEQ